jgi:beta-mannanase
MAGEQGFRRTVAAFSLAALCMGLAGTTAMGQARQDRVAKASLAHAEKPGRALPLGIYDPHDRFKSATYPRIEHVFVYWQALDKRMLAAKGRLAEKQRRTLMVTVEPYTKAADWRAGGHRLFSDILAGGYDGQIEGVCRAADAFPGQVWLRWGHEMEDPTDRYPWARRDAKGYIAAYRYFVEACRRLAPRARFVWSPKGERNLAGYYPGDPWVDMVGVAVWGTDRSDRDWYGKLRSFSDAFGEKYGRVEKFRKPVIIAELGVAGQQRYRDQWLTEIRTVATGAKSKFPLLAGLVYFNDKEPHRWPGGHGAPDWRVTPSDLAPGAGPSL